MNSLTSIPKLCLIIVIADFLNFKKDSFKHKLLITIYSMHHSIMLINSLYKEIY